MVLRHFPEERIGHRGVDVWILFDLHSVWEVTDATVVSVTIHFKISSKMKVERMMSFCIVG